MHSRYTRAGGFSPLSTIGRHGSAALAGLESAALSAIRLLCPQAGSATVGRVMTTPPRRTARHRTVQAGLLLAVSAEIEVAR
ncbi:hypothetical protein [Kitasatospora sp. NPDC088346]|uniref:hypothetical protein n=1 Tax=Kitasatospora sp. NPDC088346 TaxID=3364073 RepID=UPI00381195DC